MKCNMIENNFMAKDGGYPWSRDFALPEIPCDAKKCVANNGRGKCVMPSCIEMDNKGKCKKYHKCK